MNVWKLTAANKLTQTETENPAPEEGKVRVRITKILFDTVDAAIFRGQSKAKYPLIPGRFAVGLVTDERSEFYPKGTRVLLHAAVNAPDTGTEKKDFSENDYLLCGRTADGYLRDIVYRAPDEITALPDPVDDERALLLHYVATAKAAIERLDVKKGRHIAVAGADMLGIFVCQLLIYQQAAPILIDSDARRLEFARACGVYYTLEADEHLLDNMASITGGRLAGGAVFVATAGTVDCSVPLSVCAQGATVALCGSTAQNLTVELDSVLTKQLTLACATGKEGCLESAINLAANSAVDTSCFRFCTVKADDVVAFLKTYCETDDHAVDEAVVISLI